MWRPPRSCYVFDFFFFFITNKRSCTVQYCTVLYSTVQYCTVLHSTAQYCTVLYSTVQYCSVLFRPVPVHTGSGSYRFRFIWITVSGSGSGSRVSCILGAVFYQIHASFLAWPFDPPPSMQVGCHLLACSRTPPPSHASASPL